MNIQDIYRDTQDIKKALIAKGYTSADCWISFNFAGSPIFLFAEASTSHNKMVMCKTPTNQALQEGLDEIAFWIRELPNAKEQARSDFLKMFENLPAQAAECDIELPVKLGN